MAGRLGVRMSFATIFGAILGFGLFVGAILLSTDNFMLFVDAPSLIMVVGGTFSATFVSFEPRYVLQAMASLQSILFTNKIGQSILTHEVGRIIRWGYIIQKSGLAGLESDLEKFVKRTGFSGLVLIWSLPDIPGRSCGKFWRQRLKVHFSAMLCRPTFSATWGDCPGFRYDWDAGRSDYYARFTWAVILQPSAPGMAVALVTTLYGVMFARMILLPAASKVQQREEIIRFRNYLFGRRSGSSCRTKAPDTSRIA